MAESFTSYKVDNDRRFRDAIARAAEGVKSLKVPFGLILQNFYKSEQAIWQLKGPGLYPPFKHSATISTHNGKRVRTAEGGESPYQKRKLKKYGHDYPLLVATGALAASLSGPNNPGSIADIQPLSLTIGTSIHYGIYHQSDRARSKIPLRKFLFIGPEAPQFAKDELAGRAERWLNILNDFALKTVKRELANGAL